MTGFGGQYPFPEQFWYVYILNCSTGEIYTGCTNNLEDRIKLNNLDQTEPLIPEQTEPPVPEESVLF